MRRRRARQRSGHEYRQRNVEKRFVASVVRRLEEDVSAGKLTGPHELHDRVLAAADASLCLGLARRPYRIPVLMRRVMDHAISGAVRMLAGTWVHEGRRRLDDEAHRVTGDRSATTLADSPQLPKERRMDGRLDARVGEI
jgi:hypothetical protein